MNFTFPILTLCKGGAQRMLVEISNGLVDKGHEVTILMPPQGEVDFEVKGKIIRTKGSEITEGDYPKADVIVSNYFTTVAAAEAASQKGKGLHVRLSLCYEPTFLPQNHLTFPTYHITDKVVVLSKWQQEIIFLNHGVKGEIVPVGVSPVFNNLNIRNPANQLQVSCILRKPEGGFSWHREQDFLINALITVKQRYPNVKINCIIPPSEFSSSPSLQQLKNTHPFTIYTPANDIELSYHYNETDIFVNSSTYDTASLPGLEAMKCGASLVTINAGGNQDYCRNEQNCLISYKFQNRLADDVARLITNQTLRKQLALAGEQEAKKWTWDRSVATFEKAIYKFINK
ncbi:MAG: glycosyltransferase family 4 protein [Bacillaceae bacterium]|nr:glycosyltransferase family 4 protein [Bacillaceae bacterium]